jgi:hypothetical protein
MARSSKSGFPINARAKAARCFWPPEVTGGGRIIGSRRRLSTRLFPLNFEFARKNAMTMPSSVTSSVASTATLSERTSGPIIGFIQIHTF